LGQHRIACNDPAPARESDPGGYRSTEQARGFLEREVARLVHQRLLAQHGIFRPGTATPSPGNRWFVDSPLEGTVWSEPVSEGRIPCYTGNLQGILSFSVFAPDSEVEKEQNSQWLANKFPAPQEQGINFDLSGN
jgi:hypothetical protein